MIVHVLQIYLLELVICQLCILETREGGAGLLPIYEIVRICGENSLLFKHCQVYDKPPLKYMTDPVFHHCYMNGRIF